MTQQPAAVELGIAYEHALNHAWSWFSLHSAQRMQFVNYMVVSIGLIVAAYGAALQGDHNAVAGGIAVLGVPILIAFERLDARTRDLIKIAESALSTLERRLAESSSLPDLLLVERAEHQNRWFGSYTRTIRALLAAVEIGLLAAAVYAFA
jgi:hypothetical protein